MSENNGLIPAPAHNTKLIRLEDGCRAIAEAKSVESAKNIRDAAQLMLHYVRERDLGEQAANDAAEIKVRAERRMGELLIENPPVRHRPAKGSHNATLPPGVTRDDSSRCQALASLSSEKFDEEVNRHRAGRLTSSAILKTAKTHKRKEKRKKAMAAAAADTPDVSDDWKIIHADLLAPHGLYHAVPSGMAATVGSHLPGFVCESPSLIFADPPYNVGIDYGDGAEADSLLDEEYLRWVERWLTLCHDRLTPDGTMWVLIGDEYADHYSILLSRVGFHRRAWVKWYETFGVCNSAGTNFSRSSRHLFYCVKNPRSFTWNLDAVTRPSDRQAKYADARADPDGKVWDDVWQIPRLTGTCAERIPEFPTQLPLALLLPVVGATSAPGDLVLDPFAGSATSGVAALRLGRRYLGIEKQPNFARIATQRLEGESNGNERHRRTEGAGLGG